MRLPPLGRHLLPNAGSPRLSARRLRAAAHQGPGRRDSGKGAPTGWETIRRQAAGSGFPPRLIPASVVVAMARRDWYDGHRLSSEPPCGGKVSEPPCGGKVMA